MTTGAGSTEGTADCIEPKMLKANMNDVLHTYAGD
jgi:hypothetical protein